MMRKIRSVISLIAFTFMLACTQPTAAQQPREQPDMTVDAAARIQSANAPQRPLLARR